MDRRLALITLLSAAAVPGCQRRPGSLRPTIAVIPKGQVHIFWQTVRAGAEAAAKEAGVEMVWAAPQIETDFSGQASIVEDFINRRVSAIVIAPSHQSALVGVVDRAIAAGIPVVVMDSALASDRPASYVATDNRLGGALAAREMGRLIGGRGKVAVVGIAAGTGSGIEREEGFTQTLEQEFPTVTFVGLQYCDSDRARALTVAEDFLTTHPDLAGMFGSAEPNAVGIFRAVQNRGKKGQVKVVGFDASPQLLEALGDGTLDALVVQNPFRIGHDAMATAASAVAKKPVEKRIDTGVVVVTRDNLQSPAVQDILSRSAR
ncbi:MAG TPA: ABC transporter substrate-binding protein [Vicinamibacteria bacterium]